MKMSYSTFRKVSFLAAMVYFTAGYLSISWYSSTRTLFVSVSFPFENEIPFIPAFIFGYLLVYFCLLGLFFLVQKELLFKKTIAAFFLLTTIHFVFFLLTPVQMFLRPVVINPTGFVDMFVKFYYWIDMPYNCFPSLHVAYTLMGVPILWNYKRDWAYIYLLSTIIVAISVVLVKQHYILDTVGGLITPFIVWWTVCRKFRMLASKRCAKL